MLRGLWSDEINLHSAKNVDWLITSQVSFNGDFMPFSATFPTEPVINPTKSCIPTTITVVEPCQQKVPRTVTVTVTSKPSTCICATRTLTQTVTQTKTITKSASLRISVTKSSPTPTVKKTVSRSRDDDNLNRVEDPKGCKALPPSSLIDSEKGMPSFLVFLPLLLIKLHVFYIRKQLFCPEINFLKSSPNWEWNFPIIFKNCSGKNQLKRVTLSLLSCKLRFYSQS